MSPSSCAVATRGSARHERPRRCRARRVEAAMARRVPLFGASVNVLGILVPTTTAAEPVVVQSGHVGVGGGLDMNLFTTGPHLVGEFETGVSTVEPMLFGRPGDTVNLSSHVATALSNFS